MKVKVIRRGGWMLLAVVFLTLSTRGSGQEQAVASMAKEAHPSFEVATIKLSDPDDQSGGFHTSGHRLFYENETMNHLIAFAYGVHPKQIGDAPDWFSKDRYDIKGMPDVPGEPGSVQQQEMLQKLLAERFHLKLHREKRELSIFAVTLAKGGAKMAASKSDPDGLPDQTGSGGTVQSWRFTNNSMAEFASMMQYFLDRPVLDLTGLKGKYDFRLKWTADGSRSDDPEAPPGLFTAMQEQLGLKVDATKGPAEVLVIKHVERPSEN